MFVKGATGMSRKRDWRMYTKGATGATGMLPDPLMYQDVIKGINEQMEQIEVVREWERHKEKMKPFQFAQHAADFEAMVHAKKVKFSYDKAPHQAVVSLYCDTSVVFREPYEAFPSDWMMAQIALALTCAIK